MQNLLWQAFSFDLALRLSRQHGVRAPRMFENVALKQALYAMRALPLPNKVANDPKTLESHHGRPVESSEEKVPEGQVLYYQNIAILCLHIHKCQEGC